MAEKDKGRVKPGQTKDNTNTSKKDSRKEGRVGPEKNKND